MKTENPVYLKLEYSESVYSKKNILSTEMSLLNIAKIIKKYQLLREEEFILRIQIYKLIKEINSAIRKTKTSMPSIKIPEKQKGDEVQTRERRKIEDNQDLEEQLQEIQEKLKELENTPNQ